MQSKIERQVMAAVGVIYAARLFATRVALECYVLFASAIALWQLTWVHKVFANFFAVEKNGVGSVATYLLYAVEHTHLAVQVTLLVAAVAFISLVVDAARSFTTPRPRLHPQTF